MDASATQTIGVRESDPRTDEREVGRLEWIAERTAIRQFDGGLDEWEAARLAVLDWEMLHGA